MDDEAAEEGPGGRAGPVEEAGPPYLVSLALQRGPYPYEQRTTVIAALDADTEAESHPDGWLKAIRRAHKEGGEVRVVRIALDAARVASVFDGAAGPRPGPANGSYRVRLALCQEVPPVVVAALDEEMAESMGIYLAGQLPMMPLFYRRQVARAFGEVREILVTIPRAAVDAAFQSPPVAADVSCVLTSEDPRF